jgi:hypothetical protein
MAMYNTIIISGSSRKDGNTARVVQELRATSGWEMIDLLDYEFSYYDYEHKNYFNYLQ